MTDKNVDRTTGLKTGDGLSGKMTDTNNTDRIIDQKSEERMTDRPTDRF
jgi:hypothetical protein